MDRTVVALFDDVNTAQRALEDLLNNGFERNNVSIVRTNDKGDYTAGQTADDASGAAAGAGIGAALGGIAGLVVGLGVLAIPGLGPVIAAGPIATTLAGAGLGAAAGGIIGALTDVGIPKEEAGYYAEGVRRGGTLLTVRANDNQVNRATDILNRYSPVDINQRAAQWRSTGWSGFDPNAGPYETGAGEGTRAAGSYPGTGGTYSSTGGTYSGASSSGTYSGTGGTHSGESGMGASGTYAGMGAAAAAGASRFEDFDNDFRSDYQTRYGNSGFDYSRYQPAYRYGWEAHNMYQGRNWNDVQSQLQSDWQRNHPNDKWEDFKDSIQTGWEKVKGNVSGAAQDVRSGNQDVSHGYDRTTGSYGSTYDRGYDRTTSDMSRNFDQYDRDFRSDWEQSFRSTGYGYERYQPAYMYGYDLATEDRYRGRKWNEIEPGARLDWESRHPSDAWDDFKDAIRHAYQRVRSDIQDATS
jgi:hypothetical protein